MLLILVSIMVGLAVTVIDGSVLAQLWAWFATRAFALPPLDLPSAMGIILTVRLLNKPRPPTLKEREAREAERKKFAEEYERDASAAKARVLRAALTALGENLLLTLMILAFGWLLHRWCQT